MPENDIARCRPDATGSNLSRRDPVRHENKTTSHRYYFCLTEGFSMYSYSCTIDVLRAASLVQSDIIFETNIVSNDLESIRCGNGTRVLPDLKPQDMKAPGILVVVAGTGATLQKHENEIATIRLAKARGFDIWGISSGVISLARAGVLDRKIAAAHWEDFAYLKENFPKITLSERIFERSPKVSTCVGGAAASDMVLSHLNELVGKDVGVKILSLLNIETRRDERVNQLGSLAFQFPSRNDHVKSAVQIMQQNLNNRPTIPDIASAIGISQKQLERLFKSDFNQTPKVVFERMCMEHARRQVVIGGRPIGLISQDYGYSSSTFAKKYKQAFGVGPIQDRHAALGTQKTTNADTKIAAVDPSDASHPF